jgi:cellobiose phosphorylase
MNSGMACRAFSALAVLARARGEENFAVELERYVAEMREAVARAFDGTWFVGGYDDSGNPIGSLKEDRLFLNAQTWAVLGNCGTREQQRSALRKAVEKCHTSIGLMLMSRPYSSPAPEHISWCAIPAGDGENAGIWPQTIYWAVWALAEQGMLEEALEEWSCGTLRNHARMFPDVPFGIFNGPDCFSSVWAGRREGFTQIQLLDRARFAPMSPMVAWQGFALRKINQAAQQRLQRKNGSPEAESRFVATAE